MKIVCEACQAKYRIPDERVAGKRLKIRCRKCGGGIVIMGDQLGTSATGALVNPATPPRGATLPPPTEVMRASRPPRVPVDEWYVSVSGVERGPMTTGEVVDELSAGTLGWDVHVWREGFPEWLSARECPNLVTATERSSFSSPPSPPSKPPVIDDDAPTAMFDADRFAAQEPATSLVPRERRSSSIPPLASQPPAASRVPTGRVHSSPPMVAAGSAPPRVMSSAPPMRRAEPDRATGARNENSVLFSAANMHDLSVSQPQADSQPPGNGYASGDGSGLIDIRALATLAKSSSSPPAMPVASVGAPRKPSDELMTLAHQTGAFANIDSLAPVASSAGSTNKAIPLAILAGSLIVAAAASAVIWITRTPAPGSAVAAAAQPTAAPVALAAAEPAPTPNLAAQVEEEEVAQDEGVSGAAEEPSGEEAEQAGDEEQGAEEAVEAAPSKAAPVRKTARKQRAPRPAKSAKVAKAAANSDPADKGGASIDDLLLSDKEPKAAKPEAAEEEAVAVAEPKKPAAPEGDRSIDDLLNGAVDKSSAPAAAALPAQPGRAEVLKAMRGVQEAVRQCASDQGVSGKAVAAITVAGSSGKVSGVQVTGVTGPAGSCIAKAVRSAKFPKFSKPDFSINYPFKLP